MHILITYMYTYAKYLQIKTEGNELKIKEKMCLLRSAKLEVNYGICNLI